MIKSFVEELKSARAEGKEVILVLGVGVDNETFGKSIGELLEDIERITGEDISTLISAVVVPDADGIEDISFSPGNIIPHIGLSGPSLNGKMNYGIIKFRQGERQYWEEKGIEFLPVKIEVQSVESRIPGIYMKRPFYSIEDAVDALSRYIGVEKRKWGEEDERRLLDEVSMLYEEIEDEKGVTAGLYEMKLFLENRDIKKAELEWLYSRDIAKIENFLRQSNVQENIDKADAAIRDFMDRYGENDANFILGIGIILEQYNMKDIGDIVIRFGLYELLSQHIELDHDMVRRLALRYSGKNSRNESPSREAGGIVIFI